MIYSCLSSVNYIGDDLCHNCSMHRVFKLSGLIAAALEVCTKMSISEKNIGLVVLHSMVENQGLKQFCPAMWLPAVRPVTRVIRCAPSSFLAWFVSQIFLLLFCLISPRTFYYWQYLSQEGCGPDFDVKTPRKRRLIKTKLLRLQQTHHSLSWRKRPLQVFIPSHLNI